MENPLNKADIAKANQGLHRLAVAREIAERAANAGLPVDDYLARIMFEEGRLKQVLREFDGSAPRGEAQAGPRGEAQVGPPGARPAPRPAGGQQGEARQR